MRVQILKTDLLLRGNQCKEMRVGVIHDNLYQKLNGQFSNESSLNFDQSLLLILKWEIGKME